MYLQLQLLEYGLQICQRSLLLGVASLRAGKCLLRASGADLGRPPNLFEAYSFAGRGRSLRFQLMQAAEELRLLPQEGRSGGRGGDRREDTAARPGMKQASVPDGCSRPRH